MRNRHRRMYELTGLPGWMRFGYSPGWLGRSPSGLGPCAQYLMHGVWPTPQMNFAWQQGQASDQVSAQDELESLKKQSLDLRLHLDLIAERIAALEKKGK